MKPQQLNLGKQIQYRAMLQQPLAPQYINTFVQLQVIAEQLYIRLDDSMLTLQMTPYEAETLRESYQYLHERLLVRIDEVNGNEVYFTTFSFPKGLTITTEYPLKLVVTSKFLSLCKSFNIPTTNVVEFLTDEFLIDDYAFAFSQQSLEEITLIGENYLITFKQNNQRILMTYDFKKRPKNIGVNNIAVLRGAVSFQEHLNDAQMKLELEKQYEKNVRDNEELLRLWRLYGELELSTTLEESEKLGFVSYHDKTEFYDNNGKRQVKFLTDKRPNAQFSDTKLGFAWTLKEKDFMNSTFIGNKLTNIQKVSEFEYEVTIQVDNQDVTIPDVGYICGSIVGSKVMNDRRNKALEKILNGSSALPTLKYIIQSGEGSTELVKPRKAITNDLLKKIFNDASKKFTSQQEASIGIGLNANDLVIIQGPPGTGKTTVIRSIVHRINEVHNGRVNILISSAQHDAVDNAIQNMEFCGLPANRIGGKMGDDELKRSRNIIKWLDNVQSTTENLMQQKDKQLTYKTTRDIYGTLQDLYMFEDDPKYTMQKLHELASLIKMLPDSHIDIIEIIEALISTLHQKEQVVTHDTQSELVNLLQAQRLTMASYLDDGAFKLGELMRYLKMEQPDFEMPKVWNGMRLAFEAAEVQVLLPDFKQSITELLEQHQLEIIAEEQPLAEKIQQLHELIVQSLTNKKKTIVNVLQQFQEDLNSPSNIKEIIEQYTKINASTCQQAVSKKSFGKMDGLIYDYVIIDEAARANPLDLLIPMSLGRKIILVGDHKQLPHILEPEIVKQLIEAKKDPEVEKFVKNSLFERLFDLLNKNKDAFGVRTTMLTEQYRMHPVIGTFVSDQFYEGKLKNGVTKEQRKTNVTRYDEKAIAWLNVDAEKGPEKGTSKESKYRPAEVERLQKELYHVLQQTTDETIGIITFYKRQLVEIEAIIKTFPEVDQLRIEVGTVDSFQGKEFDFVFLSTVRSNKRQEVGFVSNANRLNVAFSRAKRVLAVIGDRATICGDEAKPVIPAFAAFEQLCKKEGYYDQ